MNLKTIVLIQMLCLAVACTSSVEPWPIDKNYSSLLLGGWQIYRVRTGLDVENTVDAVQIFSAPNAEAYLYTIGEIREQRFIYETTQSEFIAKLFSSVRSDFGEILSSTARGEFVYECSPPRDEDTVYFILAFDSDLHRVGGFKYYECEDGRHGSIRVIGDSGIFISAELRSVLDTIVPTTWKIP